VQLAEPPWVLRAASIVHGSINYKPRLPARNSNSRQVVCCLVFAAIPPARTKGSLAANWTPCPTQKFTSNWSGRGQSRLSSEKRI